MTKKQYNFIVSGIFSAWFLIAILVKIISGNNVTLVNVTGTLIAISAILVGVYFYFSAFRKEEKIIKPILIILFGICHMALTSGHALTSYHLHNKIVAASYNMPDETLIKLKEMALSNSCPDQPSTGKMRAKAVFDETGERVDYLNKDNKVVTFTPSIKDIKKRNIKISLEKELLEKWTISRRIIWLQLITATLSIAVFLFLMWYIPPRRIGCKT